MGFTEAPTLETARVRLEQLDQAHAADLSAAVAENELWRTWYTAIPSPDQMEGEIERRRALQADGQMAPFAVIEPQTGKAVGMTTYMNIDEPNRRLEIGSTWLATRVQRTGLNKAMKLLMLRRAFEDLDCIAVEFRTHWHNLQSRQAIAELGAKQDGVLRNHKIGPEGTFRDTVVFSIIASEWPTVKLGLESRIAT
ncbi:MAG: GNAT family N-acetyltransferase [Agromyces sp.]